MEINEENLKPGELHKDKVTIMEVLNARQYGEKYGDGVTQQALYHTMDKGLIDWVNFGGRERYVVMTQRTKAFKFNPNKRRRPSKTNKSN